MANAAREPNPLEYQTQRAIILRRADEDVIRILKDLQKDVQAMLREIAARPAGISRDIREAQLRLVQRNLHAQLGKAWREIGNVAQARRYEAAVRSASYAQEANAFRLVTGGVSDGGIIAENIFESEVANAASGIDRMIARQSGASYVPLSERVYNSDAGVGSKVDRLVNSALARGLSAVEFASEVRAFVNPLTPGGVSYAAKRLARTEINNAAHAMSVEAMREVPWCDGMKWHLSGSHGRPDVCDQLASGGANGDGIYPKTATPSKPHPQCLCYVTPDLADDDEFERNLLAGHYNQYLERYRNIEPGQIVKTSYGGFNAPPAAPKPKKVTPTKTAQAPKKAARPPSAAKPKPPGSTGARTTPAARPVDPAMEVRIRQLNAQGATLAKARNAIAQEFNISKEEAEALVRQVTSTSPVSLISKQAKLTEPRPTSAPVATTRASSPARVTSAVEDRARSWVPDSLPQKNVLPATAPAGMSPELAAQIRNMTKRWNGQAAEDLRAELYHQGDLTPGVMKHLDEVHFRPGLDSGGSPVNGTYSSGFVDGGQLRWIDLSDRIFEPSYGREQLQSEITGFKTSCGADHTGGQSVLAHEYGHHVDFMIDEFGIHGEVAELWNTVADTFGVARPANGGDLAIFDWMKQNRTLIQDKVSGYAVRNRREFMAEIWREYSGNPKARPQIKQIGQKIQELADRLFK
jgi:hypothetical protein